MKENELEMEIQSRVEEKREIPLPDYSYTQNRELSWLRFNERVLSEAKDPTVPLLERLRFLSIFCTNLDEFYMIRVGSLFDLSALKKPPIDNKSGLTPKEQLALIFKESKRLCKEKDRIFAEVENELRKNGIVHLIPDELEKNERKILDVYFKTHILPILSPQIIDKQHPFPHFINKRMYIFAHLRDKKEHSTFGIVPIPTTMEMLFLLPPINEDTRYIKLEKVILLFFDTLFQGYRVESKNIICVTRNADISPEDEVFEVDEDYRTHMKKLLKRRTKLHPVRLEIDGEYEEIVEEELKKRLDLKKTQIFKSMAPIDLTYAYSIAPKLNEALVAQLSYEPYIPTCPATLNRHESMMKQIQKKDCILFYPYHQMEPFLDLIKESARDKNVLSIKITIYRLGGKSKLLEHLCYAAENGKEVTVLMELRARFDEQNNINWSEHLEEAGCKVIYGTEDMKTHSKICHITYRDKNKIGYITQIGTGNYNEKTAKLYTDLSLITANREIGEDANTFFKNMSISNLEGVYRYLLVAPSNLKSTLLTCIDSEIQKAREGKPAKVIIKANSVTERELIDKLSEASNAGVKVLLLVRGICCILPDILGKTENVTIVSIVGRFLEHPRIYAFGEKSERVYISSADMMTRNLVRRVEIACPIFDPDIKMRIVQMLEVMEKDNVKGRRLTAGGVYMPNALGEPIVDSQGFFMEMTQNGRETFTESKTKEFINKIWKKLRR